MLSTRVICLVEQAFQHPPSLPGPRGAAPVDVYGSDKPAIVLGVAAALLIAQLTYAQVGMCTLMTYQIDDIDDYCVSGSVQSRYTYRYLHS